MFATNLRRSLMAAVAVLTPALQVQLHDAGSTCRAEDGGRDLSVWVRVCSGLRASRQVSCPGDRSLLFPQGPHRTACLVACENTCLAGMQACKAKCNVNREPPAGAER